MPFRYILANLIAANPDAVGAIFLDDAGETIDFASSEFQPFDLQVEGAYIGIYLRHVTNHLAEAGMGEPRMIHIAKEHLHYHVVTLKDGYFVVLLQNSPALVARARRTLMAAAHELCEEVFGEPLE